MNNNIIEIRLKEKNSTKKTLYSIEELYNLDNYNDIVWLRIENITFTRKIYFPLNLEQLYMTNCENVNVYINYLPENMFYVSIINCKLISADDLFSDKNRYNKLESINLSFNRIKKFPSNLPQNILSLDLSYNVIKELSLCNIFPPEIHYINLDLNQLQDLPEWIIYIDNNNISFNGNPFWFSNYSNVSLNRMIPLYYIDIAQKYFNLSVENKIRNAIINYNNTNGTEPHIYLPSQNGKAIITPKTTAEDIQNVHNSSIQDSFSKSVIIIMNNSAPKTPNFLNEVYSYYLFKQFNIFSTLSFYNTVVDACNIETIHSKCGVSFAEVFERVWSISAIHPHKTTIRQILKTEITDGRFLCFTGKITRLVNTLSGFLDDIQIGYNEYEQINNAVIATIRKCENNTNLNLRDEVKKILDELNVHIDKQNTWLDALE